MKIGFLFDDTLDKPDGVQQYILTLGTYYASRGHEVHYLTGNTLRRDLPNVHSLARNMQVRFNNNRVSTPLPANKKRFGQLLDTEDFDVLHVQLPYSPLLAGRVLRRAPGSTVLVGTFHILPFSGLQTVGAKALGLVSKRTFSRLDAIYSVSEPAQQFANKMYGVTSTVRPNVIDLQNYAPVRHQPSGSQKQCTIVFLGRLVERKGCWYVLRAAARLRQVYPDDIFSLRIAGKGPQLKRLKRFVAENNLADCVEFLGYVDEDAKAELLAGADIGVFPSTGGESFGIVLIEAMAAGAGIILAGKNAGYAAVMAGRTAQLIDPYDTSAFAEALHTYISNPAKRRNARVWQQEHVRQFDVRVVGEELLSEYARLRSQKQ